MGGSSFLGAFLFKVSFDLWLAVKRAFKTR